jgi:hypothetical protein
LLDVPTSLNLLVQLELTRASGKATHLLDGASTKIVTVINWNADHIGSPSLDP